ncbi:nitrogen fixation protein NifX [Alteromonadaceae bacterium Bs31]|nr:nitrogen fixation protein NifX [Alteromonadaceae bacterium Bs31]
MSAGSLNRDTALRIALAARVLPGISVAQLLELLSLRIQGELNEKSLTSITVTDLKKGFGSADGGEGESIGLPEMKEAVRILWGETDLEKLPQVRPMAEMPERSVRVAIASNTSEKLDGHFGSCIRFLIYQVSAASYQLIDIRSSVEADLAEDRNAYRAELVADCQVLYVVSVGGPAAAKVVRAGVYPIKKPSGGEAGEILAELQTVMKNSPPPWLAKHLGDEAENRVRFEREELVS